ncbi:hypothetical protein [Alloactinosynnema sp. L-07]|uniref:hypothetical protein n=1 Tax=Alloactinosynnema sp. L-07 TaxID=1653480 RepID=UPI00065EFD34|nr:hypothetical protein [Alloactinosynnema sp. L-07]CRK55675.1 hypothetical protein [Alloactinosynnema sp. L-07]
MGTPDPDTMDELIADCADITSPHIEPSAVPGPRYPNWSVDDATAAQVADMDAFI